MGTGTADADGELIQAPALSMAVLNAADALEMNDALLANVLQLSEPVVTQMRQGDYFILAGIRPFKLAALFVRLQLSLKTIARGDRAAINTWLRRPSAEFGETPLAALQTVEGLVALIQHLDERRALV